MPTSKANIDIIGYLLVGLAISFFLLMFFTKIIIPPEQPSPTSAQVTSTGTLSLYIIGGCKFNLSQGWNFISFCVDETNKTIESVLAPVNPSIRFVLEWNSSAQEFIIYSPKASDPPFTKFNFSKSYFIYYTDTTSSLVSLTGEAYGDINISLQQGWETPNYPYVFQSNITKYLNTIDGKYRFLQKWNYTPQEFIIYSSLSSDNPFYQIEMGEGQFLLITDPAGAILRYNKTDLQNG